MGNYQQLKDLEVYVIARKLADQVWKVVVTWDYFAKRTVGDQLVRAVDSISANIAESYGRHRLLKRSSKTRKKMAGKNWTDQS